MAALAVVPDVQEDVAPPVPGLTRAGMIAAIEQMEAEHLHLMNRVNQRAVREFVTARHCLDMNRFQSACHLPAFLRQGMPEQAGELRLWPQRTVQLEWLTDEGLEVYLPERKAEFERHRREIRRAILAEVRNGYISRPAATAAMEDFDLQDLDSTTIKLVVTMTWEQPAAHAVDRAAISAAAEEMAASFMAGKQGAEVRRITVARVLPED